MAIPFESEEGVFVHLHHSRTESPFSEPTSGKRPKMNVLDESGEDFVGTVAESTAIYRENGVARVHLKASQRRMSSLKAAKSNQSTHFHKTNRIF